jgi:limonene-1,2-epoxide hydrolase
MTTDASPEEVVREFCAAWERKDPDELLGWFAPDAVYHNMPVEPAKGHDAIRAVFDMFLPMATSIRFEILSLGVDGNRVYTERVDHFETVDGRTIPLPVAGVFEIADGKITAWRDYFDLQTFLSA